MKLSELVCGEEFSEDIWVGIPVRLFFFLLSGMLMVASDVLKTAEMDFGNS